MADKYDAILLFGAPGAGKGTQGKMLSAIPGYVHLSTGDMFRGLDKATPLGKEIVGYMSTGELVPDELTVRLFGEHVQGMAEAGSFSPATDILMLDGIPRSAEQARLVADAANVVAIVHFIAADESKLIARLKGRALKEDRPDDAKEDVVRRRLQVYHGETKPILDQFDAGLVHEVDAIGLPARVLLRVLENIVPVLEAHN
ncbi:MAG: nucleoside monophosphate kinase [Planctomycetota bacterium]